MCVCVDAASQRERAGQSQVPEETRIPCISWLGRSVLGLIPCITLPDAAFFYSSMSIQNLPFRVSRGRLIAAMAASALDPHLLVGLDAKSTPRARSFRERAEVCLLCVSDACLLDAPACLLSPWHTTKWITFGSSARRRIAETQRPGCSTRWTRRAAGGKSDPARRSSARARES